MALDVSTTTRIQRPVEVVSVYAANPDHAPEWYVNIESIAWRSEPELRVGAQMDFVAHFFGRRIAYTYDVVEYEPGRRLVMRTSQGPFPMETTYTWDAAGPEATDMTLRNCGQPDGYASWLAPFMSLAVRRANRKDLARLKRILESR